MAIRRRCSSASTTPQLPSARGWRVGARCCEPAPLAAPELACSTPHGLTVSMCGWRGLMSTASMPLASESLRLPSSARCLDPRAFPTDGCPLRRPTLCGQARTARCVCMISARHRMANAGCTLACAAAPVALPARSLPRLRCRGATCCEHQVPPVPGAPACPYAPLRSGGHPATGSRPRIPALPSPPSGASDSDGF